jgi:type IV secretion system protein VirB4
MGRLLDAERDGLRSAPFQVFEVEELMALGDKNLIPVLLYLFHRIEQRLRGQPALLILDEAWVMLGHPVFREKIREWLKVMRKANCAVVLATQSLSDASRSGLLDVLTESCPTRILLPNYAAREEGARPFYEQMGLNARQIEIIASATPKRHYYYLSPEGRRLFDLNLGPIALAFCGASSKEGDPRGEASRCLGRAWPQEWLRQRGIDVEACRAVGRGRQRSSGYAATKISAGLAAGWLLACAPAFAGGAAVVSGLRRRLHSF